MGCSKTLNLNPKNGGDTPLQSAIYSASQDAVYSTRGQWIYKFNATTGAKITEFRFRKDVMFSESYIIELGGFLYVGAWRGATANSSIYPAGSDIFKIDYALTTPVALGLNGNNDFTHYQGLLAFGDGYANLCTDGTNIYGLYGVQAPRVFRLVPTAGPTYPFPGSDVETFAPPRNCPINDMAVDMSSGDAILWMTGTDASRVYCMLGSDISTTARADNDVDQSWGVCVVPNANPLLVEVYFVTGGQILKKADVPTAYGSLPTLTNFTLSDFTIPDSDAQPMRVRYCAHDGLLYIPGWINDKVYTFNRTSHAFTSTSGYTNAIDAVFQSVSPFKKWAVQDSATGLREII